MTTPLLPTLPAPSPARRNRIIGRIVRFATLFAVIGGIAWAGYSWGLPSQRKSEVLTAVATRGTLIITVTERGELESAKSTQVICEVEGGGKLATILPEGSRVRKGDEIARLDIDMLTKTINEQEVKLEAAQGKAKAAISELEVQKNKEAGEIAKADLALTLAQIDHESYEAGEYKVEIDKRKGDLELAKKELKEAEDALDFTRSLVKKGFGQLEQLRAMELNVEGKGYKVRQLEADLMVLEKFTKRRKLTELTAKAEDAKREMDRTKKSQAAASEKASNEVRATEKTATLEKREFDRLKLQLNKCILKAPQDGIVIYAKRHYWDDQSEVRPGATLYYQQPIVTLPDLDKMQVKLRVHESVVKKVQKGQKATFQMEAYPGHVLNGTVVSVATQAQSQGWRSSVKEYETVVSIDDLPSDAGLRPGMTAETKVLLKTIPDALSVPVQSVTEFDGKQVCYVQINGKLERREVQVGDSSEQLIQILSGIDEGERVALDARLRAAAEMKTTEKAEKPGEKKKETTPTAKK